MQDTIIKGTGNSRTLRSVPNFLALYPTYEAFAAALAGGTLPVDLGALNGAGVNQAGTALSKATLLNDAVEVALWGNAANRSPNDALWQLSALITTAQNTANGRLRVQTGSYSGTGETTKALSFNFTPLLVLVVENIGNNTYSTPFLYGNPSGMTLQGSGIYHDSRGTSGDLRLTWGANSVTWTPKTMATGSGDYEKSIAALNGKINWSPYTTMNYHYIAVG